MKKGWQTKKLGDVCAFDKAQGIHRGLPYVGLEQIESHTARFIGSSEPQPVKSSTFRFSEDHVLYGRLRPYLNKALAPDFEGHCSTEIFPIKPRPELSREYLLYWLLADETCDLINETCTGARMPRADMKEVLEFDFPLPPLPEQQRIVGILDEAFEGVATAKANAEKNLQNARALFDSHLHSIFTHRGDGWVEKRLGELAQLKGRIGWRGLTAKEYTKSGPLFLSVHSLNYGDYVDFRDAFHISDERYDESPEIMLQKDDVLICKDGAGIGKCGIVGALSDRTTINSSLLLIRSGRAILPKFLYHCLCSPYFQRIVNSRLNGATTPHLYQRDITEFPVFLPPIPEQHKIVIQLDAFSSETQRLESIYQQKLVALEALKKSLLHQAFTGQLTMDN